MIKLEKLTKTYVSKKGIKTLAVDDVSLRLAGLGLVFVVGKSGCGKTTLLNLIGGMDKADSGKIIVNDEDIAGFDERALDDYRNDRVGFVFQEYQLLDNLTAGENVGLALWLQGKKAEGDKIAELFARLDLVGEQDKLTSEMSGGQKQRVAIARALIKNPRIILADEPTGALDSKTGQEIFKILKQISRDRLVIVVSHDIDSAEQFADRIIELSDGKITSDKTINKATSEKANQITPDITTNPTNQITPNITTNPTNQITPNITTSPTNQITDYKATDQAKPAQAHKNRLSVKKAFKLGFRGMFCRKFRLLAALFLSLFALVSLGFFSSFLSYDKGKIFVDSMYDRGDYFLPVVGHQTSMLTSDDFDSLSNVSKQHSFFKVYKVDKSTPDANRFDCILASESKMYFYSRPELIGAMEMDSSTAKEFGFELIKGAFPTQNDEILVSKLVFTYFKDLGYRDYITNKTVSISSYDDLIGKKFGSEAMLKANGGYKIVGILDTNFDFDRYDVLKEIDPYKDDDDGKTGDYFYERLGTGAELVAFFATGFFKSMQEGGADLPQIEFIAGALSGNRTQDCKLVALFDSEQTSAKSMSVQSHAQSKSKQPTTQSTNNQSSVQSKSEQTSAKSMSVQMRIGGDIMYQLNSVDRVLVQFAGVFLIAGIATAIISFVMIFNYFAAMTSDERQFISKLRALGASRKTITKIYLLRTLLIAIFLSLISPPLTMALINILTQALAKTFGLYLKIFTYNPLSALLTTAFCLLSTTTAAQIPTKTTKL